MECKLRVLGEALDGLEIHRRIRTPHEKLKSISERHLESVDTRRIFEHWHRVTGKNGNVKLTPERRMKVQARLKQGYSVDDILKAIDGCAASDFHMARGEHKGGTVFNDLTLICRNDTALEMFIERADEHKPADPKAFLA